MTWSEDEEYSDRDLRSYSRSSTRSYSSGSDSISGSSYRSSSSDEEEDTGTSSEEYTSEPPLKRLKTLDDKISTLPDSILHHILSFNDDIVEVMRTSEISRRWRSIWKSVPSLHFHYGYYSSSRRYNSRFAKFVDRIFLLRNEDAEIDKLCLSCGLSCGELNTWVNIAQKRNLRELSLSLSSNSRSLRELPQSIFTLENIKVVRLGGTNCSRLHLPKSMCFAPHLKTIELTSIVLPERNRKKEVIITCPVLEELRMTDCDHHNIRTLHISAPQLKSLAVKNRSGYTDSCEICIFTPSIVSLELKGPPYKSYSFGDLSSLVNATFTILDESVEPAILYQVLRGLYNVRNLKLAGWPVDSSEEDTNVLDKMFKPFLNLRCLEIIGFRNRSGVGVVRNLLTNAPSLENLILEIENIELNKDWTELSQCVSRLKSIEINWIEGRETELKFFEFVLGNAVVLEAFFWTADDSYYEKTRKDRVYFHTQLHSLPRANPIVQLIFDP